MRRSWIVASSVSTVIVASLVGTAPTSAECMAQGNEFPPYTEVAPTADRVVIGTVVDDLTGPGAQEPYGAFVLRVDEVLKGSAPDTLEVRGIRSGLPLRGAPSCRGDAYLMARVGDVLAIAFDGRFDGQRDVNTAAWVEGRPVRDLVPGAQVLNLREARRAATELPPTDTVPASDTGAPLTPIGWVLASLAGVLAGGLLLRRRRRLS